MSKVMIAAHETVEVLHTQGLFRDSLFRKWKKKIDKKKYRPSVADPSPPEKIIPSDAFALPQRTGRDADTLAGDLPDKPVLKFVKVTDRYGNEDDSIFVYNYVTKKGNPPESGRPKGAFRFKKQYAEEFRGKKKPANEVPIEGLGIIKEKMVVCLAVFNQRVSVYFFKLFPDRGEMEHAMIDLPEAVKTAEDVLGIALENTKTTSTLKVQCKKNDYIYTIDL